MGKHLSGATILLALAPLRAQVVGNGFASTRSGFSHVTSAPRRYTVGPFLEFRLRGAIAIESGALYRCFGFDTASRDGFPGGPVTATDPFTTGNSWEFPILAKLPLRFLRGVNGFLATGPSIRRLTGITETGRRTVRTLFPPPATTATKPPHRLRWTGALPSEPS